MLRSIPSFCREHESSGETNGRVRWLVFKRGKELQEKGVLYRDPVTGRLRIDDERYFEVVYGYKPDRERKVG